MADKNIITTAGFYPDPEGSLGKGIEVTGWTEDAWRAREEAIRRYNANQEWRRNNPTLAWLMDTGGNALSGIGNFVNDEIFLNKGNIRVRNARAHPDAMNAIQAGGNLAGGLFLGGIAAPALIGEAIATAPTWGPLVQQAARTLASPKYLAAETVGTLGLTAKQWLPWLIGGSAVVPVIQNIQDNGLPVSEITLPRFEVRDLTATAAPADSTATGTSTPPAAPADSTRVVPTPSPSPAPNPGNDENQNNDKEPKKWYQKFWETSGEKASKWDPKVGRFARNWGIRVPAYTAIGAPVVDIFGNIMAAGLEPNSVPHEWQWKATSARFLPERTLFKGLGHIYMNYQATPGDSLPQQTTVQSVDTVPAVTNEQLPNSSVVNANSDWEEWLKSRGTE